MVSICASEKSLYDLKKSFRNAMCWESLVAFLNAAGASGAISSVLSFQALGSRGLMVYSPDRKSI